MPVQNKASLPVINRLPKYYRYLTNLSADGREKISSSELAHMMGTTASQVRQDFNCFGGFGQQGIGYKVDVLRAEIGKLLFGDGEHSAQTRVVLFDSELNVTGQASVGARTFSVTAGRQEAYVLAAGGVYCYGPDGTLWGTQQTESRPLAVVAAQKTVLLTASSASDDRSHSSAAMVICQQRLLPFICSDA